MKVNDCCHRLYGQLEQTSLTAITRRDIYEIAGLTLPLQKSRMLQIQGIRAAAVVFYRKALITPEMGYYRLSLRVNNMAVFTIFWMSLGVSSTKVKKMSVNTYH